MSNWTHVAATARIDSLAFLMPELDFENVFGKALDYDSPDYMWAEQENDPEKYLPMGSEGTLKMMVWANPDTSYAARYTVTIFGDLRDHYDPQEIVDWFKRKLKGLIIRQAVITVENEWRGTITWTYSKEENG